MLKEMLIQLSGLFLDGFLQYPVFCSSMVCIPLYIFYPVHHEKTEATKGWRWVARCIVVFVLLSVASIFLTPVLTLAPDRIIFRPTPSCSTYDNPTRYICLTLDDHHRQVFYTTTWQKCNNSDANIKNASNYYIISSWIPSFEHFVTTKSMEFQPESSPSKNKTAYTLPENYCVRAARPTGGDQLKVAFYSISGNRTHLLDSGYVNSSFLKPFYSGWYLVSNCRSDLSRRLYNCTNGYVSSNYVRLSQYTRALLLENRDKVTN